jgi:GNAT superfamily N-acetyltransferase
LGRDVRPVIELLGVVFGPSLDAQGRRILDNELTLTNQPALRQRLYQARKGISPGYVWEEERQIVGNVSILPAKANNRYLIANVAVHPRFRRRGIARILMQHALTHLRAQGGEVVLLQVQADNSEAIRLYQQVGFDSLGTTISWERPGARSLEWEAEAILAHAVIRSPFIRPLKWHEWRAAVSLDRACLHPDLNWPEPPADDAYKSTFTGWLDNWVTGRRVEHWIVEEENRLQGLASIDSQAGRPHQLTLRIRAGWNERLAPHLLAKLLRRLAYLRRGDIRLDHSDEDTLVTRLLTGAGFRQRRTLTVMKARLSR